MSRFDLYSSPRGRWAGLGAQAGACSTSPTTARRAAFSPQSSVCRVTTLVPTSGPTPGSSCASSTPASGTDREAPRECSGAAGDGSGRRGCRARGWLGALGAE
jgi:hypothetical protein